MNKAIVTLLTLGLVLAMAPLAQSQDGETFASHESALAAERATLQAQEQALRAEHAALARQSVGFPTTVGQPVLVERPDGTFFVTDASTRSTFTRVVDLDREDVLLALALGYRWPYASPFFFAYPTYYGYAHPSFLPSAYPYYTSYYYPYSYGYASYAYAPYYYSTYAYAPYGYSSYYAPYYSGYGSFAWPYGGTYRPWAY